MKLTVFITTLMVILVLYVQNVNAILRCSIQFFDDDKKDWEDIASGYLLALEDTNTTTRSTSAECKTFGEKVALVNNGLVTVMKSKDKWIDKSKVTTQSVLKILTSLLDIYVIFLSFFSPLDWILNNSQLMAIPQ